MNVRRINAPDGPIASGGYAQATEAAGFSRIVHVSGQIPVDADGRVPQSFEDQARFAWRNIERQLAAADMGLDNIVKHTTFLASRDYREANSRIRAQVLGHLSPALTVVIAEIFDEAWLLEIEAVAVA
jgi:2-iminobutanoate/2-iminopropanoate deaminase